MFTPRRVSLFILGLVLFGTAFGVYARFLGWIDGLPELPEEFLTRRADNDPLPGFKSTPVEIKLQMAFGPGCPENGYTIKIEMRAKGIVLAANDFGIDPEGRVRLKPFSLATFRDHPGQLPEINTVHCDVAYLEFDRPVKSVSEIGTRRIVGFQLESDPQQMSHDVRIGKIFVVNNRSTLSANDDLMMETPGPVFYRETAQGDVPLEKARPQIWTGAAIKVVDRRHQPQATTVTAQGMQVYLSSESRGTAQPVRKMKSKSSAATGVRRVVLPANVEMNLWLDPKEGFVASGGKSQNSKASATMGPAGAGPNKPLERTNVKITTLGPFTFDVLPEGDRARFERLPPAATQLPNCVRVIRPQFRGPNEQFNDQLECDSLELQFAHKALPSVAPGAGNANAKAKSPADQEPKAADRPAIDWAHAKGQYIILTSDEEKLEARGTDLHYDARSKSTSLKGSPEMVAIKDGHEIHAPELVMYSAESKDGQYAEAHGAGYFRLTDRAGTKRTVEARWRDQMIYRRENKLDLLTLVGEASFEDRGNNQSLRADQLKLSMAPEANAPDKAEPQKPSADGNAPKFRPQRLEATGHVSAQSPELIVHDTEQLILLFKDLPPANPSGKAPPASIQPVPAPGQPVVRAPAPGQPGSVPANPSRQTPQPTQPKKPIDLAARTVQAFIVRQGEITQFDTVHCEGDVHVHQDPTPPQEKPMDMRGRALQLKHTINGNILTVSGTTAAPGEVHFPELSLLGPNIVIDQVENVAEIQGMGSMRVSSTTDLQGNKLTQATPLEITWKRSMKFNGKDARFDGLVQAHQGNTEVLCESMLVYLNRPVSLNQQINEQRGAGKEAANVDKVICDSGADKPQGVIITEVVRENGRLTRRQRMEADEVALYKEDGRMDAANRGNGRGNIRLVQLGPKGDPGGRPAKPGDRRPLNNKQPQKPPELEYKLTWVRYTGTMKANNQTRTANFWEGVEILHMPLQTPDDQPQFDATVNKLPPGAVYLRSNQMTVYSNKDAQGQVRQQMEAIGKASVTYQDVFFGTGDVIKFDEAKQQMTLEGTNGGYARAVRLKAEGSQPKVITARKITYNRATDSFEVDGAYSVSGN